MGGWQLLVVRRCERGKTGFVQNPSISFAHELDHALGLKNTTHSEFEKRKGMPVHNFKNEEEHRVVTGNETKIVEELKAKGFTDGVESRKCYCGFPFPSKGPTTAEVDLDKY